MGKPIYGEFTFPKKTPSPKIDGYKKGGLVMEKLEKHAALPASKAHGKNAQDLMCGGKVKKGSK